MVNKQQKQRFIQERYPNIAKETEAYYLKIMTLICEIEDYYKKDLAQFSTTQLNGVMEKLSTNYKNYVRYLRIINNYLDWCGAEARPDISFQGDTRIAKSYFESFDVFYSTIANSLKITERCVEAFYGLILMLSWAGLERQEIYKLQKSEVNYECQIIKTQRRLYKDINPKIIDQCNFCANLFYYESSHKFLVNNSYMFRKVDSGKSDVDKPISIKTIHHAFDVFNERSDRSCTFNTVRKSALFEFLHNLEIADKLRESDPNEVWGYYLAQYYGGSMNTIAYIKQDYLAWRDMFYEN